MADDRLRSTRIIDAPAETIFAVLADPANHVAIDGTGWVRGSHGTDLLTAPGQIFRMSMYHVNHPDGTYQVVNRVQEFDFPSTISWEPGYDADDGTLGFGGWIWRYDLTPGGASGTAVTLTYDWSAVPDPIRDLIGFPPFPPDHLANSLDHLAEVVGS